jgi:hypothetical protein
MAENTATPTNTTVPAPSPVRSAPAPAPVRTAPAPSVSYSPMTEDEFVKAIKEFIEFLTNLKIKLEQSRTQNIEQRQQAKQQTIEAKQQAKIAKEEMKIKKIEAKHSRGGLAKKVEELQRNIEELADHGELTNELMGEVVSTFRTFEGNLDTCQTPEEVEKKTTDLSNELAGIKARLGENQISYEGSVLDFFSSKDMCGVYIEDGHKCVAICKDENGYQKSEISIAKGEVCVSRPESISEEDALAFSRREGIKQIGEGKPITDDTFRLAFTDIEVRRGIAEAGIILKSNEKLAEESIRLECANTLLSATENDTLENNRYRINYDANKHSIAVLDTFSGKAVRMRRYDEEKQQGFVLEKCDRCTGTPSLDKDADNFDEIGEISYTSRASHVQILPITDEMLLEIVNTDAFNKFMQAEAPKLKAAFYDVIGDSANTQRLMGNDAVSNYYAICDAIDDYNKTVQEKDKYRIAKVPRGKKGNGCKAFIKIKGEYGEEIYLNFDRHGNVDSLKTKVDQKTYVLFEMDKENNGLLRLTEKGSRELDNLPFTSKCYGELIRPILERAQMAKEESREFNELLGGIVTNAPEQTLFVEDAEREFEEPTPKKNDRQAIAERD